MSAPLSDERLAEIEAECDAAEFHAPADLGRSLREVLNELRSCRQPLPGDPCAYCGVATLRGGVHRVGCWALSHAARRSISDERLLEIKKQCAAWHCTTTPELVDGECADQIAAGLGEALNEIDLLRAELKQAHAAFAQARSSGGSLDGYREVFLQRAIIALGSQPQHWREREPGEQLASRPRVGDREPHECAKRALKLWLSYVALDRSAAR